MAAARPSPTTQGQLQAATIAERNGCGQPLFFGRGRLGRSFLARIRKPATDQMRSQDDRFQQAQVPVKPQYGHCGMLRQAERLGGGFSDAMCGAAVSSAESHGRTRQHRYEARTRRATQSPIQQVPTSGRNHGVARQVNFLPKNLCLLATLCSTGTRNVLIIKTENPGKIIAVCYAKRQDLVGFLRRNGRSGGFIRRSPTGEPHNTDSKPGHAGQLSHPFNRSRRTAGIPDRSGDRSSGLAVD